VLEYGGGKVEQQGVLLSQALPQAPLAVVRQEVAAGERARARAAGHTPRQGGRQLGALAADAGQLLQQQAPQLAQLAALLVGDVEGAGDLGHASVGGLVGHIVHLRGWGGGGGWGKSVG
jgi:hypothetical protein